MADDLRAAMRRVLPIDPDDGTIPVAYDGEGAPVWGRPTKLLDDLTAMVADWLLTAASEARGTFLAFGAPHGAIADHLVDLARSLTQSSTEEVLMPRHIRLSWTHRHA